MFEIFVKVLLEITFVVCGCHVYKDLLEAEISLELPCLPELDNYEDHYAKAIY